MAYQTYCVLAAPCAFANKNGGDVARMTGSKLTSFKAIRRFLRASHYCGSRLEVGFHGVDSVEYLR